MPYTFNPFTGNFDFYSTGGTGPQGPTGDTGAIGVTGPPGEDGEDSLVPGPQGVPGVGTQGPTGATGATGRGIPGEDGLDGDMGLPGPIGPRGPQGDQGVPGFGSPGPEGIEGAPGEDGPQGLQGIQGIPGITGVGSVYKVTNSTSGDPSNGHIGWNNATQINATIIRLSHLTDEGTDITAFLDTIRPETPFVIQDKDDGANFQKWVVNTNTPFATYIELGVGPITSSGGTGTTNFPNQSLVIVVFASARGTVGPAGPIGIGEPGEDGADSFVPGPRGLPGANGAPGADGRMGPPGADGEGGGGDDSIFVAPLQLSGVTGQIPFFNTPYSLITEVGSGLNALGWDAAANVLLVGTTTAPTGGEHLVVATSALIPKIFGSDTAGANLDLQSTSSATRGVINAIDPLISTDARSQHVVGSIEGGRRWQLANTSRDQLVFSHLITTVTVSGVGGVIAIANPTNAIDGDPATYATATITTFATDTIQWTIDSGGNTASGVNLPFQTVLSSTTSYWCGLVFRFGTTFPINVLVEAKYDDGGTGTTYVSVGTSTANSNLICQIPLTFPAYTSPFKIYALRITISGFGANGAVAIGQVGLHHLNEIAEPMAIRREGALQGAGVRTIGFNNDMLGQLRWHDTIGAQAHLKGPGDQPFLIQSGLAQALQFTTNAAATIHAQILSTGLFGIGTTTPTQLFDINNLLQVNAFGDLVRIKNVPYLWPGANASGVLTNDGVGTLSWSAAGASGAQGARGIPGNDGEDGLDSVVPGPQGTPGSQGPQGLTGGIGRPGLDADDSGDNSTFVAPLQLSGVPGQIPFFNTGHSLTTEISAGSNAFGWESTFNILLVATAVSPTGGEHLRVATSALIPEIHGSNAASGTLVLRSTTDPTKGIISADSNIEVTDGHLSLLNTGTAKELRLFEPSGSGAMYSSFKTGVQGATIDYTLPLVVGTVNQVLTAQNGTGTLIWSNAGATGPQGRPGLDADDSGGDNFSIFIGGPGGNVGSGVSGTGTATQVAFWNSATGITGDNAFFWDNANKRLGIGTTTPTKDVEIVASGGAAVTNPTLRVSCYTSDVISSLANIRFYRSLGTPSVRSAVTNGTIIGTFSWDADDGAADGNGGFMTALAESNWTGASHAMGLYFAVTPIGSTITGTQLILRHDGIVQAFQSVWIRNVQYSWPVAASAGVLTSDGAGALSWVPGGSGAAGAKGPPGADGDSGGGDDFALIGIPTPTPKLATRIFGIIPTEVDVFYVTITDGAVNANSVVNVWADNEMDSIDFSANTRAGVIDLEMRSLRPEFDGGLKGIYNIAYVVL